MANIIILTNTTEYSYHNAIRDMIYNTLSEGSHAVTTLDINTYKFDHECLNQIKKLQPDILITLDLAGFRFRTQSGENALNMLHSKNLNLIWGNKSEYAQYLNKKISLSMLFYDCSGKDYHLPEIYPNLLYYKAIGSMPTACSKADYPNQSQSVESFQQIWSDFIQEVLLPEA